MSNSYRDLIRWQKARTLVRGVYAATKHFPDDERYGLISQLRRAGVSVIANIAEGQGRNTVGEFQQFLGNSKGSLTELETELIIAEDLGYLRPQEAKELPARCDEVSRLINGLMRSLSRPRKPLSRN
jgi:four helix bundle protein